MSCCALHLSSDLRPLVVSVYLQVVCCHGDGTSTMTVARQCFFVTPPLCVYGITDFLIIPVPPPCQRSDKTKQYVFDHRTGVVRSGTDHVVLGEFDDCYKCL